MSKTVLQITTTYQASPGSIMKNLQYYGNALGYRMIGAYGRGYAPSDLESIKIGNKIDIYIHGFKTRVFDRHGFGSKRATKKLINKIKKINPDIIHLHNIHGYYINIEILFSYLKEANKKVVWTLHDAWPFTGHSAHFNYPKVEGWQKNGIHKCEGKKRYPQSYIFDRRIKNGIDKVRIFSGVKDLTIVTPSNWLKELVQSSFLAQYKVITINNGVDLNIFKPRKSEFKRKYGIKDKKIILGVASIWDKSKGFNTFIELSKWLDTTEVIVMVGLKKNQMKNLPKNIIGISRTNNAIELAEIYSAADVFFNPTLEDNYPTVNLEAQACGLPVVTFDTGGSPESGTKICGIVVENKVDEILKALRNITNNCSFDNLDTIGIDKFAEQMIETYKI